MARNATRLACGCACGAACFELDVQLMIHSNDHCTSTLRRSGSTSVVNGFIEATRLNHLSGKIVRQMVKTGSGEDQVIVRCAECGTAQGSHFVRRDELTAGAQVATVDDAAALMPDAVISIADRVPRVASSRVRLQFTTSSAPASVGAPDRLSRLQAVIAPSLSTALE